jgi:hypothetical protein
MWQCKTSTLTWLINEIARKKSEGFKSLPEGISWIPISHEVNRLLRLAHSTSFIEISHNFAPFNKRTRKVINHKFLFERSIIVHLRASMHSKIVDPVCQELTWACLNGMRATLPRHREVDEFRNCQGARWQGVWRGCQMTHSDKLSERWLCCTWLVRSDDRNDEHDRKFLPAATKFFRRKVECLSTVPCWFFLLLWV